MTFSFYTLVFIAFETLHVLLVDLYKPEDDENFTIRKFKTFYAHNFVANMLFVCQVWVHGFILYQVIYYTNDQVQYRSFDTYDPILKRDVPPIVAFNNFNLLEPFYKANRSQKKLAHLETKIQACINEYVEARTRVIARQIDYAIGLSFINMDALKCEEFQRSIVESGSVKVKEDADAK